MKVIRLLIYEGPEKWMKETLDRSIHGTRGAGPEATIKAFTLGTMPDDVDVLVKEKEKEATDAVPHP